MRARMLGIVAALLLIALIALDAQAEYTVVGAGIRRVLTDWSYQPTGVSELNFVGFTTYRDAGTLTISGGGSNPAGCQRGYVLVAADDGGQDTCVATVSIDPGTGNMTLASGVTIDGRDVSVDGAKLDGLPAAAVATSAVSPQPDGGVNGTSGTIPYVIRAVGGVTVNGDASYKMPNGGCSIAITANQLCRVQVQWFGKIVGGLDANNIPSGDNFIRRTYQVRNASNVLTVTTIQGETDRLSAGAGTAVAGTATDGSVLEPTIQGNAATTVIWECEVTGYACTAS